MGESKGGATVRELTPTQQSAVKALLRSLELGPIVGLRGPWGSGRTTTLRALHEEVGGGAFLTAADFAERLPHLHPLPIETIVWDAVGDALKEASFVIIDDLDLLIQVAAWNMNPQKGLLEPVLKTLCAHVTEGNKRLVFCVDDEVPRALASPAYTVTLKSIDPEDYDVVIRGTVQGDSSRIDAAEIHRAAPKLNLQLLAKTCRLLEQTHGSKPLTTKIFIDYLSARDMVSQVELSKVVATDFASLRGIDDVVEAIETHVALPVEDASLAREFQLQPKHGVLLIGPPGTGKTTIGKALAHRLKGRFFLLDGTAIAGTGSFYNQLTDTFRQAQENAPSVIFIDDSDVLFGGPGSEGIYRYFLTQLDGLEGKRSERVCIVMTAMGIEGLPPALIRSGRLELWLELSLPDDEARAAMFADFLAGVPSPLNEVDVADIASATDGFSGADVRRVVEDAKLLYAYAKSKGAAPSGVDEFFRAAIALVTSNKAKYQRALQRQPLRHDPELD